MSDIVAVIAGRPVTVFETAVLFGSLVALLLAACLLAIWRIKAAGRRAAAEAAQSAVELEGQVSALLNAQSQMTGRMQAMAEMLGGRQAEMSKAVSERLDGMAHRIEINRWARPTRRNTHDNLKRLHERLAVLDAAQQNITDLTGQVTT